MNATPGTDTVYGVGARTRLFLRDLYPKGERAKAVAGELGISLPLANKLLQGYAPRMWLFEEMVARWDGAFLRVVFVEAFAGEDARLAELEREVEELRASLTGARGLTDGDEPLSGAGGASEADQDDRGARIAALVHQLVETIAPAERALELVE
ncbi:hypothetical protein [Azospirillum argentinense]|uniref:Uncharacterized protein n=1 Tax=Azospirillum brasilense TaxID=192 RepID=A0A4D8QFI1_AZOBR|nr:hypothetical protein [Azospirillum argentinense]QCO07563.1 hypothetical protein D3867_37400 [Azospirillum argentinense]